ncbi:MAG: hypothetical protein MI750_05665 [Xanthomonadales bacterium]|jgi:hypothetical protein|nr:hypothetical protein [Xanthomonadales bacterium]
MHAAEKAKLDLLELHQQLSRIPGVQRAAISSWIDGYDLHLRLRVIFFLPEHMNEAEHFKATIVRDLLSWRGRQTQANIAEVLGQYQSMLWYNFVPAAQIS